MAGGARRGAAARTHNNKQLHTDNQFTSFPTWTFENGTRFYVTLTQLTHTSTTPGEKLRTLRRTTSAARARARQDPRKGTDCCNLATELMVNWLL